MFKSRSSSARGLNGFNSQAPIIPHALALVNKSINRLACRLRCHGKPLHLHAVAAGRTWEHGHLARRSGACEKLRASRPRSQVFTYCHCPLRDSPKKRHESSWLMLTLRQQEAALDEHWSAGEGQPRHQWPAEPFIYSRSPGRPVAAASWGRTRRCAPRQAAAGRRRIGMPASYRTASRRRPS
ncbi:MAG: hypothetical protein V7641_52 [Blastocatellia bacterium]